MSGILLPGQDKPSSSGGGSGIELPKGFSRRRDESAEQESAPAETPDTSAREIEAALEAAPEAAPQRRGRPGEDLLFPPTRTHVQCPNCGHPYAVPIFTIVDLG